MQTVERLESLDVTLNTPSEVDNDGTDYEAYATLVHEFGDTVVSETRATRVSDSVYQVSYSEDDLSSSGVHHVQWRYEISSTSYSREEVVYVYDPYITKMDFFSLYPDLEDEHSHRFDKLLVRVKNIIDTYCGQSFDYIKGKTLKYEGAGNSHIYLGRYLQSVEEVLVNGEDDTADVEVKFREKDYLHYKKDTNGDSTGKFSKGIAVSIKGDWGWKYVPSNIERAAELLIYDHMVDDHDNYRHGINQVWMDSQRFEFSDKTFDGTGNLDADVLLMDYVYWVMDYVT